MPLVLTSTIVENSSDTQPISFTIGQTDYDVPAGGKSAAVTGKILIIRVETPPSPAQAADKGAKGAKNQKNYIVIGEHYPEPNSTVTVSLQEGKFHITGMTADGRHINAELKLDE
ncbi:hypothetical protein RHS03_08922, partial [Rhizoctonia solani]